MTQRKVAEAARAHADCKDALEILEREFKAEAEAENSRNDRINTLFQEKHSLAEKLAIVKSSIQKTKAGNAVVSGLREAQKAGQLRGFFGRLGDLGTIPREYDVAITTACGNLDSMVVENTHAAEQCINYLREHRLGRANFICLDKVEEVFGRAMSNNFLCPETAHRIFDLVRPNDLRFRIAFYYGLKDTLVCQTIDAATAINRGPRRHRIVTVEGALVEQSGTISGGGRPKSGGMSAQRVVEHDEGDLNKLQKQHDTVGRELDSLLQQRLERETRGPERILAAKRNQKSSEEEWAEYRD